MVATNQDYANQLNSFAGGSLLVNNVQGYFAQGQQAFSTQNYATLSVPYGPYMSYSKKIKFWRVNEIAEVPEGGEMGGLDFLRLSVKRWLYGGGMKDFEIN